MEIRGCLLDKGVTYTNIHTGYSRDPFIFRNHLCVPEKWFGEVSVQTVYIQIRAVCSIFPHHVLMHYCINPIKRSADLTFC